MHHRAVNILQSEMGGFTNTGRHERMDNHSKIGGCSSTLQAKCEFCAYLTNSCPLAKIQSTLSSHQPNGWIRTYPKELQIPSLTS
jgi:hypothetical protein